MMEDILADFIKQSLNSRWSPSWPLPADIRNSDWPWLPVSFDADFDSMLAECRRNDYLFVGHRQKDQHLSYRHEGWSAITLHGINSTSTENFEQYGFTSEEDADYNWTEVCELFPRCVEFLKSLGYTKYSRVRIMKLKAGGYIMPHVDGPGRVFGPLNIAINNPQGCEFYFKDRGRVPFKQGQGFFLDIGREHIVWNNSGEDRYHFIVHGQPGPKIQQQVYTQFKNTYDKKKYKIAYGVYNQKERINNEELYARVKGASLFYLERIAAKELTKDTIFCSDTISDLLEQTSNKEFDYCVVIAAGCLLRDQNFNNHVEEFIDNNDFGIAGHPLWKQDRWLELHHQFFIVNLQAWREVGSPSFGYWKQGVELLPVVERSQENFHDDYTPLWVKPTGEMKEQANPGQGWQLMSAMFTNNLPVITLSEKLRLGKLYVYPEHKSNDFLNSIKTLTPYEGINWNQNKWIEDALAVKDQIWLFNSETMKIYNTGNFDLVANTASGFKLLDLFKEHKLNLNAKIIIYDFNSYSIDWFRHFWSWHDLDLIECIRAFPNRDKFTWTGNWEGTYNEYAPFKKHLFDLFEFFGGESKFKEYWQQFKQTRTEFYQIDLYQNPDQLARLFSGKGRKWINLSNIFSTDATQMIYGHIECIARQQRCLANLYTIDPEIEISIYDHWNRFKIGPVKNLI
jgi:hypothetical protein